MSTTTTAVATTTSTSTDIGNNFHATYLLESTKPDSLETNQDNRVHSSATTTSTLPIHQSDYERTLSTSSRDSLDLGDPEKEAHAFLNHLNNNKNNNSLAMNDEEPCDSDASKLQRNDLINQNYSKDINDNMEYHGENTVQRNSSLNQDPHFKVIREGLMQSGTYSKSVNDLTNFDGYGTSSNHHQNIPRQQQHYHNHPNNRFSYHDDFNLDHKTGALYSSNHRDFSSKQSNQWLTTHDIHSSNNKLNSALTTTRNNEKISASSSQLNTLQEKYSQAINDFKVLRSTLSENMERNLMRTEQIDQLSSSTTSHNNNNNNSKKMLQENVYRNPNMPSSYETPSGSRALHESSSVNNLSNSEVVYRHKNNNNNNQNSASEQERLFQRFSDMNLEEKFGNANYMQQQQQQQHQQQQPGSPRTNRHTVIGTGGNYDMKGYHPGYPGKQQEFQLSASEQNREFQSHLRDQAAKSNFERYLKGSFNSHHSFDHPNHVEDPGYGGSGSTSPREMDNLMTLDRFSSRSGSVASRQSQSSAVASVDSGVRMSYVGQHNSLVVVAIDFGTTFSGYAFSFTRDSSSVHMMRRWQGGDPGVTNQKTPTTLLLKPDGSFHSFGFGARDFYHDLDANDAKKWLYFDKFKMTLHGSEDLNSGVEIRAANGKSYPALKVFSHALTFFKQHVLDELSDQSTAKLSEEDITWVVTVPAIWRQPAKQFMRTAAYEAGIASMNNSERLLIALEPEAASIFCRKLRIRDCVIEDDLKAKAGDDSLISEDFAGVTQYIVVDCGGGTVDLTVHELDVTQGTLKELHKGTGGPSGATGVDAEFEKLLKRIFDADFIERYKVKRPAAWIDLMISFEAKKRTARPDNQSPLNISLPFSFIDYYKKHRKSSVESAIKKFKNPDIKWSSQGMLRFSASVMQTLFEPVINDIIGHIQNLLMKPSLKHVEHLFLVGGFAESPLLQASIREALDGRVRVIIPNDVGLAILKGAVLFGLDPTVVRVRRSAFTYGVGVLNKFDTDKHDQSKRVIKDGVVWCKDIFDCFVRVDESLGIGDRVTRSYAPARSKQKSTVINVYCTEKLDVLYTTDKGVSKCGKLRIEMPDVNPDDIPPEKRGKPRELQASMIFGDTEIKVSAVDVLSGKAARATIDFLNY